jgi:hypothetical protein
LSAILRATEEGLAGKAVATVDGDPILDRRVAEHTEGEFEGVVRTNPFGSFYFRRAVIPVLRCERYGRIINLASRSAEGAAPGEPEAVYPTLGEGIGHAAARRTKREGVPLRAGVLAAPSEARGYGDAPDTKSARDDAIRFTESTPMSTMRRSSPSKRRRAVRAAVPLSEIQPTSTSSANTAYSLECFG